VTARKLVIRTPFSLMTAGKNPSQMNSLARTTLGRFRSVEIQASASAYRLALSIARRAASTGMATHGKNSGSLSCALVTTTCTPPAA
jgi:hypothetical protein